MKMNIDNRDVIATIRELHQFAYEFQNNSEPASRMMRHAAWMIRELYGELIDSNHVTLVLTDALIEMKEWTQ